MKYRILGKTGFQISEISLGTWQVGGPWGSGFDAQNADGILRAAVEQGVNFIDTADVYANGESEKAVGALIKSTKKKIYVATKCGRSIQPHNAESYTPAALRECVEKSLTRLGLERIDLIQLHCPPTAIYYQPEIFELFEALKTEGKIDHLGVSVEKVEEGLKAIEFPNVTSVQIIFNMFRHRPADLFFSQAKRKNVGIIVRVPLASGLLTGKLKAETSFAKGDHRFFNRNGLGFDKGETFSGVPYEVGLEAVEKLKQLFGDKALAQAALRWILMFYEVTTVIPGASRPDQVEKNLAALQMEVIPEAKMAEVRKIYEAFIKPLVHHLW